MDLSNFPCKPQNSQPIFFLQKTKIVYKPALRRAWGRARCVTSRWGWGTSWRGTRARAPGVAPRWRPSSVGAPCSVRPHRRPACSQKCCRRPRRLLRRVWSRPRCSCRVRSPNLRKYHRRNVNTQFYLAPRFWVVADPFFWYTGCFQQRCPCEIFIAD